MSDETKKTDYIKAIEKWACDRGLDMADPSKQLLKLEEEVGELIQGHLKRKPDQVADSLGDAFVVMTIYALQRGLSLSDCIAEAYNTIKDRKGKMINGVFVKEADLPVKEGD